MPIGQNSSGSIQPSEIPRISIILVHGTWGRGLLRGLFSKSQVCSPPCRGKRWFEADSDFYKSLKTKLLVENLIRSFLWSGANSVRARDCAAKNLAKELSKDLKTPAAIPIIIAHSYAGNVALRALEYLRDPNLSSGTLDTSRVRIVTLATPFLKVFVRPSPISLVTAFLVVFGCLGLIKTLPPLIALPLVIVAAGTCFRQRERAEDIEKAAHYRKIDASGPCLFVIRGVADEASLAVAAGSIGSRLSSLLLRLLSYLLALLLVFGSLGFLVVYFALPSIEWGDLLFPMIQFCALSALPFYFLAPICKSACGVEFLTLGFACEIASETTPDVVSRIESTTLLPEEKISLRKISLRHFIYEHPECVNKIVNWINPKEPKNSTIG
jgi:hypothetical protein